MILSHLKFISINSFYTERIICSCKRNLMNKGVIHLFYYCNCNHTQATALIVVSSNSRAQWKDLPGILVGP